MFSFFEIFRDYGGNVTNPKQIKAAQGLLFCFLVCFRLDCAFLDNLGYIAAKALYFHEFCSILMHCRAVCPPLTYDHPIEEELHAYDFF